MQRAALLVLATPGLKPTVGFAEAVSPSTGETLFNANGAHLNHCALPRMPSGAGLQEKDTLDAHLHADETKTGKLVGDFDPVRHVTTSGPGSALAKGVGYAVSGYAMWNMGMGGTALIGRSVDRK